MAVPRRYRRRRTVERPRTTWHCHWKPRRRTDRRFSARDAGRITCEVIKQGATKREVDVWYQRYCKDVEPRSRAAEEFAVNIAVNALAANNETLLENYRAFLIVNGILLSLIAVLGVIQLGGPLRLVAQPLRLAARVAQSEVAKQITINIRQRAANDANINKIGDAITRLAKAA